MRSTLKSGLRPVFGGHSRFVREASEASTAAFAEAQVAKAPQDPPPSPVLQVERLQYEHLVALFEPTGLVAIKGKLFDTSVARKLADQLDAATFSPYAVEPSFLYWGAPLFEARDPAAREAYFQNAPVTSERIRRATWPISPLDLLCGAIRQAWPPGLRTLHLGGRACAVGIVRSLRQSGAVEAHVDDPIVDADFHPDALTIDSTLSGLIYLDTPSIGGEVRLWSTRLSRAEERAARRADSLYALDEMRIGPPAAVMKLEPGDFVLFVASRPHGVAGFRDGRRITVSTFFNHHGDGEALSLHG